MEDEQVIRREMEDTRTSLSEKLETLEGKVVDTVQGATSAVTETVEAIKESVQETVSNVKDSVQGTFAAVKDSVQGGMDNIQDLFDLRGHVERHPWIALGGSICVGYCLESLLGRKAASPPFQALAAASADAGRRLEQHRGNGHKRHVEPATAPQSWLGAFGPEVDKLKSLALGTLFGTLREIVSQAVPEHIGAQLKEVIDSTTRKIGGEPIPSSDLSWSEQQSSQGDGHATHHQRIRSEMGGPLGSAGR